MRFRRRAAEDLSGLSGPELRRRYRDIDLSGDGSAEDVARARLADALATEVLRRTPDDGGMWFDRGLFAKWRRDWAEAQDHFRRALDLIAVEDRSGAAEAWNLGIAATARRDWPVAREAWTAFGIPLDGPADGPVDEDLGLVPVRLNPPPRYAGQTPLEIDGRIRETEVVWGRRIDPARVQLVSVPLPGSGHRYGDVVLTDGEAHGSRVLDGQQLPVLEELELWERSPRPTLGVVVDASDDDVAHLVTALEAAGLAGEDWATVVRTLCRSCSEGAPDGHEHPTVPSLDGERTLGISASPAEADAVLDAWAAGGPGRTRGPVVVETE